MVATGLLAGLLLSVNLWVSSGSFPRIPASALLPPIPFPLDYLLFGTVLLLLGFIIGSPQHRAPLYAVPILLGILAAWDQSRLTAWAYQYTFLLVTLGFWPRRAHRYHVLHACRVIVASTYIWAGVHKVNASFVREIFPWLLEPFLGTGRELSLVYPLGLAAAAAETAIGVGLLTRGCREAAVWGAVGMHAFVLASLGPVGHAYGSVVWPWNAALAASVVILFSKIGDVTVRDILGVRRFAGHSIACALFGFMPALSFLGMWDTQLSAAMYSGKGRGAIAHLSAGTTASLPDGIRQHVVRRGETYHIDIVSWSLRERNVLPHYEVRIYRAIARELCRYSVDDSGMTLVLYETPHWLTGRRNVTRETCATLKL